ncbi:MAG: undecaprenyl-phosphate glucose phosphotransferase [Muribaculaceae bacterium]|nr:undecaprenyl-phosphate glucose phosphotransferase [Muribaculaceae bacterium]
MNKKGRYGHLIGGILTVSDFVVLNVLFLLIGWCEIGESINEFFTRQVWFVLNVCFVIAHLIVPDMHSKRVVYADKVVMNTLRLVAVHALAFVSIMWFLDGAMGYKLLAGFYCSFALVLMVWWLVSRKILKAYRTRGFNFKRVVIVGCNAVGRRLFEEFESDQGYGYKVLGMFDSRENAKDCACYKGELGDVESFLKEYNIDEMYCALDGEFVVTRMIHLAESNAVDFYYLPQIGRTVMRQFSLDSVGRVPVMSVRSNPLSSAVNRFVKRVFDIIFSTIVLLFSPIVLIPVSIAIKLSSPGPIFFKQLRTGFRGKEFYCYKFRTMKVNKDADTKQATKKDPRKTKVGEFLRKTSIDELPQFFNVWRGDMSVVGPRPHMLKHTKDYSALIDKYMLRHTIKPGITGWAQVNGFRGQTDHLWQMEKRVEYDVWYAENWNFFLDLKIIFLAVWNVFRGEKNAY